MLELNHIELDPAYKKKWNADCHDYCLLCKDGVPLRNILYRLGGMSNVKSLQDDYFLILKYVEAYYSEDVMKMSKTKDNKHLEGVWVIVDKNGDEKVEFGGRFGSIHSPYLISNSVIYHVNNDYINIETKYVYGKSYDRMETDTLLFISNRYDKDESKRGVLKIDKKTGLFELFPEKTK